jgi:hypothetical protein
MTALAVLGAHGGSGASTVTDLLRGQGATVSELVAGQRLPAAAVPVLVARSTARGLAAAADALASWHPGVPRPWLVVVADVPASPPPPVRYRIQALGAQARGSIEVPYLWPLRAADTTAEVAANRSVSRAAVRLHDALCEEN